MICAHAVLGMWIEGAHAAEGVGCSEFFRPIILWYWISVSHPSSDGLERH